jgi:chromosome segregation ATPase
MLDYCTIRAFEAKLDDLEGKLDEALALLRALTQRGEVMSQELDALQAQVAKNTDAEQSAVTLLGQLLGLIRANANDPAKMTALANDLDQSRARLAEAVIANTPAAPPGPPPSPTAPAPTPPASAPGGRP